MFRTVPLSIVRSFSLYTQSNGICHTGLLTACELVQDKNSICFGQSLCISSESFHCTHSNGMCHTGLLTACELVQDGTDLVLTELNQFHPDPDRPKQVPS
jgi:hypothetical protein